jgi:hypothetical protein
MSITIDAIFDGEVLRPQEPLKLIPHRHYSVTIDAPESRSGGEGQQDAWSLLEALAGTFDGPVDWSSEHDHYIYGAQKSRGEHES